MTSLVDTSVKHFRFDMSNVPVLSGTVGALIALLDAFLVNGADVKSATSLVVADGVATLSFSGSHSALVESVILVEGSSIAALNGEQRVTAVSAGVVRFATAATNATATGSITFKLAPAGWAKVFSGTNLAVYQSPNPMGYGMYLRVDDTTTTFCRVVGYQQMTDVNTGTGRFPSTAQISGGGYWPKSDAASAAARPWVIVGDSRKFYIHLCPYAFGGVTFAFGDDLAARPGGDAYACSLASSFSATLSSMGQSGVDAPSTFSIAFPRTFTGLGSSTLHASYPYTGSSALLSGCDPALGNFPAEVDGSLRLSPRFLTAAGSSPRVDLPGLFSVPQAKAGSYFNRGDTIPGTGVLAGRKLIALRPSLAYNAEPIEASTGASFVDITGPWR